MDKLQLPPSLRSERRWCVWRYFKDNKTPVNAKGRPLSWSDQSSWLSYDEAVARLERLNAAGLGFFLGDGYTGGDLDEVLDPEKGLHSRAREALDQLPEGTYIEVSPSGLGLKFVLRGSWDGRGNVAPIDEEPWVTEAAYREAKPDAEKGPPPPKMEMFGHGRFFTLTGERFEDCGLETPEAQDVLDELAARFDFKSKSRDRFKLDDTVRQGFRDNQFFRAGSMLRGMGCTELEIRRFLEIINERAEPPKSEDSLKRIAHQSARYDPNTNGALVSGHPDDLNEVALYGLVGEIVKTLEGRSEAHPAALLLTGLIMAGNAVGRGAHFKVGGSFHYPNEFGLVVGDTAGARKGQSWADMRQFFTFVADELPVHTATDEDTFDESEILLWHEDHIAGGLSSGEGLIQKVEDTDDDHGAIDKRLLVYESEFARPLKVMERTGNTLDVVLRQAWDTSHLGVMTRNNQLKARKALISIVAHVTESELRRRMNSLELVNGFFNRFLAVWVHRAAYLPSPEPVPPQDLRRLRAALFEALVVGRTEGELQRDKHAEAWWQDELYRRLETRGDTLVDHATARASAHVMRLALIYALLDTAPAISEDHLRAAVALWEYAEASVRYLLTGHRLGDPDLDTLMKALAEAGEDGLTQTQIYRQIFHTKRTAEQIHAMTSELVERGRAVAEVQGDGQPGRNTTRWYATRGLLG